MFAVIQTGGKQYKVSEGTFLSINKIPDEVGSTFCIESVLMLDNGKDISVGTPFLKGAKVTASVVQQKREKTILIFKKSRRKNYRRKNGHRQPMTIIKIGSITY